MTLLVVSTYRTCQRAAYIISPGHLPWKPTSLLHHSHQWHGALVGPLSFPPQCLPQLPAPYSSEHLLLHSPSYGKTETTEGRTVFCTWCSQQDPDWIVKKAFCCTGGISWCEAEVVLCVQGGLGWDKNPEASNPARSTHGATSGAVSRALKGSIRASG